MNKFFIICITLCLAACQNHTVYHLYQPVEPTGWNKDDTIAYTYPSQNSSVPQEIEIGIRHKDSYLYRDIWLSIVQQEQIDTVHLYLANEHGNWKGNGIGEMRIYTEKLPIQVSPKDSIHTIQITHIMEENMLKGIHDIGICIKEKP